VCLWKGGLPLYKQTPKVNICNNWKKLLQIEFLSTCQQYQLLIKEIVDFLQLCRIDLFDAHIELLHSELK